MLEEITMEKKLNRSITTPKGTVETKKNQDAVAGKSFPKSSRKREKHSPKLEQCIRRPGNSTAKNKHNSRKSTSRASHHVGGGKDSELADLDDDFDLRGSKKRNLTHLLNFHCKPRESEINTSRRATVRSPFHNTIRNLMSTQIHKYNKEQFLQANCQFVVKDGGDYSVYLADPDILVDWKLIEQILVPSSEPLVCPICLDYPSAGKITRCGHVYCWSCILHYMSLSDNSWQKCPICFESIYGKDLKSVKLLKQNIYNVGDEITFQLMKREQGSTVAIPVLELSSRISNVLLPVSGNGCSIVYSKLLLGDQKNILSIIEIEENELHKELVENKECPEVCYVEQAIQLLNERKQKLLEEITKINFFNVENISSDNSQNKNNNNILISHMESVDAGTSREISDTESQIENVSDLKKCINEQCVPEHEFRQSEEICSDTTGENYEININPVVVPIKESFFYQADDGQQIFLHSLNVRMLELQCGSLECSPIFIKGRIVEIEMGSMTDDLRKRLRHLQHLPTTCQFQVVEIVFVEPIIREEFLSYFKDHIEERSRRREKRAREEKKLQKKAEQLTKQQFGSHSPPRRLRLDSLHHFPECGSDTPPNASPTNRSSVSSRASSPLSTASRRSVSPVTKSLNSLSVNNNTFAQKLKGNNKDGIWQKRVTVSEREAGTSHSGNLISDAVEAALLKARMEKENKFTDDQQTSGKNKKKKRQKPIPLCSVGMVYSHR